MNIKRYGSFVYQDGVLGDEVMLKVDIDDGAQRFALRSLNSNRATVIVPPFHLDGTVDTEAVEAMINPDFGRTEQDDQDN